MAARSRHSPPSGPDWTPTEDTTLRWAREYPRWPGTGQVIHTFGSWNQALEAAGLGTRKHRWDRESVIAAFRAFAERHGRSPTTTELAGEDELPSRETIIRHYGSLDALREALEAQKGAKPVNGWLPLVNQRWDRERIVEAIKVSPPSTVARLRPTIGSEPAPTIPGWGRSLATSAPLPWD